MAIQKVSAENILGCEDQIMEVAARLRKLRNAMSAKGWKSFSANAGTFFHTVEKLDEYSQKLVSQYEVFERQQEIREKIRKNEQ
jgi:hypothetical protein